MRYVVIAMTIEDGRVKRQKYPPMRCYEEAVHIRNQYRRAGWLSMVKEVPA